MNYSRIYRDILYNARIQKRKRLSPKSQGYIYFEKHHIKPRCMGGLEDPSNLVLLTAREHFLAHWLLHKMYPDNIKLALAFSRCRSTSSSNKFNNSRLYKYAKEALAYANSQREWTESAKEGIRLSNSTRICTEHTRKLRSENMIGNKNTLGHKLSEEHKKKLSEWSKNMPEESRRKQVASYIERKTKTRVCEYCGAEVTLASYDKAHGSRCQLNPNCTRSKYEHTCIMCGNKFESYAHNARYCISCRENTKNVKK